MQSYTVSVTLDPAAHAKLTAAADKAGETVADHASKLLGADLDAVAAQLTGGPAPKGKPAKAAAK